MKKSAATCRPEHIIRLPRDNWSVKEGWLLCDGTTVTVAKQRIFEDAQEMVTLSRRSFNALIRGYLKEGEVK